MPVRCILHVIFLLYPVYWKTLLFLTLTIVLLSLGSPPSQFQVFYMQLSAFI